MLKLTIGHDVIDLRSNPNEPISASIKAELFVLAHEARIENRFEDRDMTYKILLDEESKFPGFLSFDEKAEIEVTLFDQLRRRGDNIQALNQLNNLNTDNTSETTKLKRLNAIALCCSALYRNALSDNLEDSDLTTQMIQAWDKAYLFLKENLNQVDTEFAVRTLEGVHNVANTCTNYRDPNDIYLELTKMREIASKNPDFATQAYDQAQADLCFILIRDSNYPQAIQTALSAANKWPNLNRYKCAHYMNVLTALVEGDLLNQPEYIHIQKEALQAITTYVHDPKNIESNSIDWRQFLNDSLPERKKLSSYIPQLAFSDLGLN